jgi:hypothetical protein
MPSSPPSQFLLAHDADEQEAHAHGGDGQEVGPHAQRRQPDHGTDGAGQQHRQGQGGQERQAGLAEHRRGVGADAQESGVAQADLAAEARDQVQRQRKEHAHAHRRQQRDFVVHRGFLSASQTGPAA